MTEIDAVRIAQDLVIEKRIPFKKLLRATWREEKKVWTVLFERRPGPGVISVLPNEIIVNVDEKTGKGEIFRSL